MTKSAAFIEAEREWEREVQNFVAAHISGAFENEKQESPVVSPFLANRLEEHGEQVLRDTYGPIVWARTNKGPIHLDRTIRAIYDDLIAAE